MSFYHGQQSTTTGIETSDPSVIKIGLNKHQSTGNLFSEMQSEIDLNDQSKETI
jgi:hypothetical protein